MDLKSNKESATEIEEEEERKGKEELFEDRDNVSIPYSSLILGHPLTLLKHSKFETKGFHYGVIPPNDAMCDLVNDWETII